MNLIRFKYKIKYIYKRACWYIGICPKCFNKVNYTRSGHSFCVSCGNRN